MTRINCIPPEELHDKHLVAEYRELPRVFKLVRKWHSKNIIEQFPKEYVLGTGHVKFFYDKLLYLSERHQLLVTEMLRRQFKPNFTDSLQKEYNDIPSKFWNNWNPSTNAQAINRARIADRLPGNKNDPR